MSQTHCFVQVEGREGPNCYRVNSPGVEEELDIEGLQTWRLISKGNFTWIVNGTGEIGRNPPEALIDKSDATSGDTRYTYTAVSWTNDGTIVDGKPVLEPVAPSECRDYRVTFDVARDDTQDLIEFGEVELVGVITDSCTLTTPTAAPFGCSTIAKRRTCRNTVGCFWKNSQCNNE